MNIKDLRNFMHALGKKIEQKTRQLKDAETEMHWNQTKLAKLKKELLKYEHNKSPTLKINGLHEKLPSQITI